ncbi:MAG: DNA replication protein [Candidatus Pelagibacter sp.]|nr:DNA replication protein [Candidatus Pelagibacter sp.]|tara:strand:+ start:29260 stop:29928 length:669 start_codon:yes stop_codon:yes gene_type:complete
MGSKMKELNQLLLNFNHKQNFNYDDFYVSKSNYFAFKIIDTWPKWEKNIVNITGEKGSGKSHLSRIFKSKYKSIIIFEDNINNEIFKKLKLYENIILENFQNKINENIFYSLFNFVDQNNKYLIINSTKPLIKINFTLNDLSSRVKNCILAQINNPDDDLIFALILKNFSDKQIKIDRKLIDYIVKRIDRSYRKISEFIYKLDELTLKKKVPISLKTIKEII